MTQRLVPYDIGCEPSPSIPAEMLLQDSREAFLLFFATTRDITDSGYLGDLGVAVVECVGWETTKFGYPNDEGLPEHPLYSLGLGDESLVYEVVNSEWALEVGQQIKESAERIRDKVEFNRDPPRHFVVLLKEKTFECLARDIVVNHYAKDHAAAVSFVHARFN
ncbi:hypothetical protein ACPA5B_13580 [Pseudomonas solani]|uniref:hypothetical protein n=1 Tax=Pseudomonas solani TaxID=2731552 RepID=UPI003C2B9AC6